MSVPTSQLVFQTVSLIGELVINRNTYLGFMINLQMEGAIVVSFSDYRGRWDSFSSAQTINAKWM